MTRQDYLDRITDLVENDWFAHHQMDVLNDTGANAHVAWHVPGSFQYGMHLLAADNHLVITGDLGDAVYGFNDRIAFDRLSGDVYYLNEKLTAIERPASIIEEQIAANELRDLFLQTTGASTLEDLEPEHKALYDTLCDRDRGATLNDTVYLVQTADIEWDDLSDTHAFAEQAHDCGRVPSPTTIAYAAAIRKIGELWRERYPEGSPSASQGGASR